MHMGKRKKIVIVPLSGHANDWRCEPGTKYGLGRHALAVGMRNVEVVGRVSTSVLGAIHPFHTTFSEHRRTNNTAHFSLAARAPTVILRVPAALHHCRAHHEDCRSTTLPPPLPNAQIQARVRRRPRVQHRQLLRHGAGRRVPVPPHPRRVEAAQLAPLRKPGGLLQCRGRHQHRHRLRDIAAAAVCRVAAAHGATAEILADGLVPLGWIVRFPPGATPPPLSSSPLRIPSLLPPLPFFGLLLHLSREERRLLILCAGADITIDLMQRLHREYHANGLHWGHCRDDRSYM